MHITFQSRNTIPTDSDGNLLYNKDGSLKVYYGNAIVEQRHLEWDEFKNFMTESHLEFTLKSDTPMFNVTEWTTKEQGAITIDDFDSSWFGYVRRLKENAHLVHAIVVDYDDDGPTVDFFKDNFAHLTHIGYTSFRHTEDQHRFRVVIPLVNPVQAIHFSKPIDLPEDVFSFYPALIEMFEGADKTGFQPARMFYVPSCPKENLSIAQSWSNDGVELNIDDLDKSYGTFIQTARPIIENTEMGGSGRILYDTFDIVQFFRDQGLYKRRADNGKHQIVCPNVHGHSHGDESGTVIFEGGARLPGIKCQHDSCADVRLKWLFAHYKQHLGPDCFRPYCETEVVEKGAIDWRAKPKIKNKKKDEVKVDVPYDRKRRTQMLKKHVLSFLEGDDDMLLYGFEGFGKSYSTSVITSQKHKLVCVSISNSQAEEQAESFRSYGIKSQFIPSIKYCIEQAGYEVETNEVAHPWGGEDINKAHTLLNMMQSNKCPYDEEDDEASEWAEEEWNRLLDWKEPQWKRHDVICTTMARLGSWGYKLTQDEEIIKRRLEKKSFEKIDKFLAMKGGMKLMQVTKALMKIDSLTDLNKKIRAQQKTFAERKQKLLPRGTILFYDDPNVESLWKYKPYEDKWENVQLFGKTIEKKMINGKMYFVRPEELEVGYGLDEYRKIFTTTEKALGFLLADDYEKKGLKLFIPDLMPENKMVAGDLTIIKTNIVGKARDGLLPVIMKRIKKEGFDFTYIANGQGCPHNLVNTKGRNDFQDEDVIVEISMNNYSVIEHWMAEMGVDSTDADKPKWRIQVILALDAMHQAIGRNSGYRWSDKEDKERRKCVILCEPKLFNAIVDESRYHFNHVVDDVVAAVCLDRGKYKNLESVVMWYIAYFKRYIRSGVGQERNAFMNDYNSVVSKLNSLQRFVFKKRFGIAIKNLIKTTKNDKVLHEKILKIEKQNQ